MSRTFLVVMLIVSFLAFGLTMMQGYYISSAFSAFGFFCTLRRLLEWVIINHDNREIDLYGGK